MKRYILMALALMATVMSVAQDAAIQQGAAPTGEGGGNVNTLYTMLIAACAATFLLLIIFALSRAVKALSSQVGS